MRGYSFRLARENLCDLEILADFSDLASVSRAVRHVSALADVSFDILVKRLCTFFLRPRREPIFVQWLDDAFPMRLVERTRRKVCASCLMEGSHYRVEWEFTEVKTCSCHGIKLVSVCERCKKPLNWICGGYFQCGCGFDLRDTVAVTADLISSHIALVISETVAPTDSGQQRLSDVCAIDASNNATTLSVPKLLELIDHLRTTFIPTMRMLLTGPIEFTRKRRSDYTDEAFTLFLIGYWPQNYMNLLSLLIHAEDVHSDSSHDRAQIDTCLKFARDKLGLIGQPFIRADQGAREFSYLRSTTKNDQRVSEIVTQILPEFALQEGLPIDALSSMFRDSCDFLSVQS